MKSENCFFELVPKVVPADRETIIEIRSLFDHVHFTSERQYEVAYYPVEEISHQSSWPEQHRKRLKVVYLADRLKNINANNARKINFLFFWCNGNRQKLLCLVVNVILETTCRISCNISSFQIFNFLGVQ